MLLIMVFCHKSFWKNFFFQNNLTWSEILLQDAKAELKVGPGFLGWIQARYSQTAGVFWA